jgi:hypothetical protein
MKSLLKTSQLETTEEIQVAVVILNNLQDFWRYFESWK